MARTTSDNPNPTNPKCSTLVQGLLELAAQPDLPAEMRAQVYNLSKQLAGPYASQAGRADARVLALRYPDRKMTYAKRARYNTYPLVAILSASALALLDLLASVADQSGYVSIARNEALEVLGYSAHLYASALKELTDLGCIALKRRHTRTSPAIYAIDPKISSCGKQIVDYHNLIPDYLLDEGGKQRLPEPQRGKDLKAVVHQTTIDGTPIRYGTLSSIDEIGDDAQDSAGSNTKKADPSTPMEEPAMYDTNHTSNTNDFNINDFNIQEQDDFSDLPFMQGGESIG